MSKAKTVRMRVTITAEYDANPVDYGNGTPEEMVEIDTMNFQDIDSLMEFLTMLVDPYRVEVALVPAQDDTGLNPS